MKIKITENGPYAISGNIPLAERVITPRGRGYIWREGRALPQAERYALCRCGQSKQPPFCDGSHVECKFRGPEVALRRPYAERCQVYAGPALDLLDDRRCAFARFCHREQGDAWELIERCDDPELRAEAMAAANECPAGRLVIRQKDGRIIEPEFAPEIVIIQDPERKASGGIHVKGRILIEAADGFIYEPRSQVALCRCGHSRMMPFCDAMHIFHRFRA